MSNFVISEDLLGAIANSLMNKIAGLSVVAVSDFPDVIDNIYADNEGIIRLSNTFVPFSPEPSSPSYYTIAPSTMTCIADAIRSKTGVSGLLSVSDFAYAISTITGGGGGSCILSSINIISNGSYLASDDGVDGYDEINVSVPISAFNVVSKIFSLNGTYTPSGAEDAFSQIDISVPISAFNVVSKTISENGTYYPSDGEDAFSQVTVFVADGDYGEALSFI